MSAKARKTSKLPHVWTVSEAELRLRVSAAEVRRQKFSGVTGRRGGGGGEVILTDVTVRSRPSRETVAVISTNQIFARISVHAGLSCTLISICGGRRYRR